MTRLGRGLAVVACVVLGLSGVARADWRDDAMAADARGDYQTEINILKPRAEQGLASAQYNLGVMYAQGQGVAQDYKTAAKWYSLAADQGDVDAQYNLGLMYDNGQGVAQDYKAAVKWYTLAAQQGFADAQNNLGVMYGKGQGVVQDYVKAHMWYNIAAIDGNSEKAAPNRDAIAEKMTPAQIARAQELASQCIAQKFRNCGS